MDQIDIFLRFADDGGGKKGTIAAAFFELAKLIDKMEIESREKTISIERLEEAYMWAKKGLDDFEEESDSD